MLSAFSLSLAQRTSLVFHQSHFRLAPPDGVPPADGVAPAAPAADGDGQTWLRLCQTYGQQSYWREGACLNPNCTSEKWLESQAWLLLPRRTWQTHHSLLRDQGPEGPAGLQFLGGTGHCTHRSVTHRFCGMIGFIVTKQVAHALWHALDMLVGFAPQRYTFSPGGPI